MCCKSGTNNKAVQLHENVLHNIILGGREGNETIIPICVLELGNGCNWLSTLVSVVLKSYYSWLRALVLVLKTGWNYQSEWVLAVLGNCLKLAQ
jgi:hypothetical protein